VHYPIPEVDDMTSEPDLVTSAELLRSLDARLKAAAREDRSEIASEFRRVHDETTGPYHRAIAEVRAGDVSSAPLAIDYLERRPRFFRSGYLAVSLLRALEAAELDGRMRDRFLAAVRAIAEERPSRESHRARLIAARAAARTSSR
jgi:hypothetical protein